ncbi:MAG: hypothetical protein QGG71_24125 [Pirellulaceae bacterium]|nr:hypothetical protein [Planctomycetaceae bacterium]MDP6557776.1 hypothetical protein [Pirellulaceae bacterium]
MQPFTVVTYFTPKFACFAPGLQEDCRRLGYRIHCEDLAEEFDDLIQAFDFKISYIRQMVRRFGTILWLDVECRIVKPIPGDWSSPLISSYQTGKSQGFSSGVLMLDGSQLEFIDLWMKYAQRYPQYPDDFVLDFLANSVSLDLATVPLEFYDRQTRCQVARGLWKNEHTVVQHPTINRWPEPTEYRRAFNGRERNRRSELESIARQRKGIFYRNFGGDFAIIDDLMRAGVQTEYHDAQWVFDSVHKLFAPEQYWPEFADDFTSKPRSFEKSRENFNKKPKGNAFRTAAIRRMHLDANDVQRYGQSNSFGNLSRQVRRFFSGHR